MTKTNKNKIFKSLPIIDVGNKSKSIAKSDTGEIVFLDSGVPGDIVDVKTYKKKKGFFIGNITKFHKYSKKRTQVKCDHFGVCGGCKWQDIDYKYQLEFKSNLIKKNLSKIAGIEIDYEIPIIKSIDQYYYRNKLEFSFSNQKWLTKKEIKSGVEINRNGLGFHKAEMWNKIVDINKCHLQKEPSNKIRNHIKNYCIKNNLDFFDHRKKTGLVRGLIIRSTLKNDFMLIIQFCRNEKIIINKFLTNIKNTFPEIKSLFYVINPKQNDTFFDLKVIHFYGKTFISEKMEDLSFKISAKTFYQTNSKQAYTLYKIVRDYINPNKIVYDLYSGTGTIALFISKISQKVIGIDISIESINIAKENAKLNTLQNVIFKSGDIKELLNEELMKIHGKPSIIITDPPREGMHLKVIQEIIKIKPNKIIYISCNSATQARDIGLIKDYYKISKIKAIDMFPQTNHVENVVLLEKK